MGTKTAEPATIVVIHGPNLNRLGLREPEVYGTTTLAQLDESLHLLGQELGVNVRCVQSNSEGGVIDAIHAAAEAAGIIINPGGYTHTSVAIADALRSVPTPALEVHLSNTYAREPFRQRSLTASACAGVVMGLGVNSYQLALRGLVQMVGSAVKARD